MKYKVVMTDTVYPDLELEKKLLAENDAEFVFLGTNDTAAIAEAVKDADAVITCYANVTAEAIKGMTKCRSISKTGIGVNNIDVAQATRQGIKVMNVPDYCIEEVSDHTVALLLSLTRRVPFLVKNVQSGDWSLKGCGGISRMDGKVFGLLGFGRIARRVADKVRPYGLNILAYDPYIPADVMEKMGVKKAEIDEVFEQADIISLNLPLTAETTGMINSEAIAKMKDGVIILNTSRGPLVNEADLIEGVKSGKIYGAGLDVICDEVYDAKNPLFSTENILVTPHAAFYSVESTQELREKILADVISVLKGQEPKYQVNR